VRLAHIAAVWAAIEAEADAAQRALLDTSLSDHTPLPAAAAVTQHMQIARLDLGIPAAVVQSVPRKELPKRSGTGEAQGEAVPELASLPLSPSSTVPIRVVCKSEQGVQTMPETRDVATNVAAAPSARSVSIVDSGEPATAPFELSSVPPPPAPPMQRQTQEEATIKVVE
jgi:hypothetical protein